MCVFLGKGRGSGGLEFFSEVDEGQRLGSHNWSLSLEPKP